MAKKKRKKDRVVVKKNKHGRVEISINGKPSGAQG